MMPGLMNPSLAQRSLRFFETALTVLIVAVAFPMCAWADDWPHWRGPNRNGITAESSGYQDGRWNVDKPLWQINVGKGSSSPLVVAGKVYTMGWKSGKDV